MNVYEQVQQQAGRGPADETYRRRNRLNAALNAAAAAYAAEMVEAAKAYWMWQRFDRGLSPEAAADETRRELFNRMEGVKREIDGLLVEMEAESRRD